LTNGSQTLKLTTKTKARISGNSFLSEICDRRPKQKRRH